MAKKNVIQFSLEVIDLASGRLKLIAKSMQRFSKRIAVSAAGMAAAFVVATKSAIGAADQIGKTAKVVGLSAEALQEFRFAAQQTGVSAIGLDDSIRRMQRRFGEFINSGAGPAQAAMKTLDLSVQDAAGNFIGSEAAFLRVVDAMKDVGGEAEKSALLAQIFGDDFGPKLLPLLNLGREGIEELTDEARELGLIMSNETIAKAEDAQAVFDKLGSLLQTKMIKAFADNAESIQAVAEAFITLTIETVNALDAFLRWLGVINGSVPQLLDKLQEIRERQNALILDPTSGITESSPLYINLENQALALIETIKALQAEQAKVVPPKTPPAGGGGGSGFAGTNPLEAFVSSFDTADMILDQQMAKLRTAIADGLIPDPAEQARIQAEIEQFFIDSLKVTTSATKKVISDDKPFAALVAAADQAARNTQDAFAEFFFDPFEKGIQGILESFVKAIRIMIAQAIALKTVDSIGVSNIFKNILGLASGGPVTGGTPYIVGERGPELFVPGASGRIVPNSALGGSGGGMQFVTNIDARGADPSLISRLPQMMEQRDRRLMIKVKEYVETGSVTL